MGNKRAQNRKAKVQKQTDPILSVPVQLPPVETLTVTTDKEKQREIDDKIYETYRSELVDAEQKQAEGYDKWILALAGVALTFSLSLVKDFLKPAKNADLHSIRFLYLSWILFGLPLALIMFNLQVSYSAYKKYRKILDKRFEEYDTTDDFWKAVKTDIARVKRNHFIESFNWISLFSFLGGIVTLVLFAWKNVRTP